MITQDWKSPIVQALRILQRIMPGRITLHPKRPLLLDLSIAMCAPHLAVGNSMLASIFAAGAQRERLWMFAPFEHSTRLASCRTPTSAASLRTGYSAARCRGTNSCTSSIYGRRSVRHAALGLNPRLAQSTRLRAPARSR